MSATQRAERLGTETRLAILENIRALRAQRRVAREQGDFDAARRLQDMVDVLLDRLDELSAVSLDALEDSDEVKAVITGLRRVADELEDEADTITDLQSALVKGAQAVQRFTTLVNDLRSLIPVPA